MATNAYLIEFGSKGPMGDDVMSGIKDIVGRLDGLKSEKVVESYRFYPTVTGNRSERIVLIVLEMSHEQLEKMVVNPKYIELLELASSMGTNVTTTRAITLEKMMEIGKKMEG